MPATDAQALKPDYRDGSIVNLMSSIAAALGGATGHAPLKLLAPAELSATNIVLLVLDGLGYQFLTTHGAHSHLARHLRGRITSVFPTTTASAVTSFLTGLPPQQHGVTGWFMHLKELGAVTAVLPFQMRGGSLPLGSANFHAADIFRLTSLFERIAEPSFLVTQQRIVDSEFSLASTRGARRSSYDDLNGYFARIEKAVRVDGRKYVYAYWSEFDTVSHSHGPDSAQARAHFAQLDAGFAALLESLAGTDTQVIVCADHGLIECAPQNIVHLEQHPQLQATLTLPLCGEPRVAYCYTRPTRSRQFVDYVAGEFAEFCALYPAEQIMEEGYFGLGAAHPQLLDRIGDYVLIMKDNHVIKDRLPNEKPFTQIGVHGGLTAEELYVPLIVARV